MMPALPGKGYSTPENFAAPVRESGADMGSANGYLAADFTPGSG
jgi:hypothetical protein